VQIVCSLVQQYSIRGRKWGSSSRPPASALASFHGGSSCWWLSNVWAMEGASQLGAVPAAQHKVSCSCMPAVTACPSNVVLNAGSSCTQQSECTTCDVYISSHLPLPNSSNKQPSRCVYSRHTTVIDLPSQRLKLQCNQCRWQVTPTCQAQTTPPDQHHVGNHTSGRRAATSWP
jgi:hypothetical protein